MSDIKIATYNKYYAMGQRAAMAKLAEDPPIPVPQPDPTENAEPTTVYRDGIPVPGPGGSFNT